MHRLLSSDSVQFKDTECMHNVIFYYMSFSYTHSVKNFQSSNGGESIIS